MARHLIAEEGPLSGKILKLEGKKQWIIGRDPDQADLVLEDATVSRKHASLKVTDKGITIKNLSNTNPLLVNDSPIEKNQLLTEGDHIKIGDNIFLYSEEDIPEIAEQMPSAKEPAPKDKASLFDTVFEEIEATQEQPEKVEEESVEPEEEVVEASQTPYDTLFEATPDEELPFDMMKEYEFILKVISGPNSGAEFGMDKNSTYIMGKDPNTCDIVFSDMSVSKEHARIMIDHEGNVFIEDLHSRNKTLVNGKPVEDKTPVSYQDIISLGTTSFIVVNQAMQFETIYSPLPSYSYQRKEEAEENDTAVAKEKVSWKEQVIPTKHLAIAASFVVMFFVVFISFFSLFKSENLSSPHKDETKAIAKIVSKYKDVDFSYNPGGENLFLVGHVLTETDQKELLYSLNQLANIKKIVNNIVIDELVWQSFNGVLSDNPAWRGIRIYSPEAGQFILQGYVQTPDDAEKLQDYINVNFPYTDKLTNQVVIHNLLQAEIANVFIAAGFQALNFELSNGDVIVTGRYDESRLRTYKNALDDLKNLKGVRSVNDLALATNESSARIDVTSKYAISGFIKHDAHNMSVVANGLIVSVGDLLDGMKITKIMSNEILLEKEGIKYKINYSP